MPPGDSEQPTPEERQRIVAWLDRIPCESIARGRVHPGRVTIRRLNRAEYNNTIRDLFGVDFKPADDFPSDDVGYGFDNIGDVLSLPPLLLEKYLAAAEKIGGRAEGDREPSIEDNAPRRRRQNGQGSSRSVGRSRTGDASSPTTASTFCEPGPTADQAGPDQAKMALQARRQGAARSSRSRRRTAAITRSTKIELRVTKGKHTFAAALPQRLLRAQRPDPKLNGDRNLHDRVPGGRRTARREAR